MVHAVFRRDQVEIFDSLEAARAYAAQDPGSVVRSRPLRRSMNGAVIIHNRLVIVRSGVALHEWCPT